MVTEWIVLLDLFVFLFSLHLSICGSDGVLYYYSFESYKLGVNLLTRL